MLAAGRDVTLLVHPQTLARLNSDGLRLRHGAEIHTTSVKAVTAAELDTTYDVIVVAIRTSAVESAIAARCASPKYNGPRSVARSTAGRTRSSATSWITSPSPIPQIDGPSRCRSGGHGVRDQRGRFGRRRRVRGRRLSSHRGAAAVRRTGVGLRVRRLGPHHHCDSLHCRLYGASCCTTT